MSKRRRVGSAAIPVARPGKRPTDKQLVVVNKAAVDGTQVATALYTATFPGTVAGLRWHGSVFQDGGASGNLHYWAIVKIPQGTAASTMAVSDAGSFYTPEGNVLAFGIGSIDNNNIVATYEGATKAMRKLQAGDALHFLFCGNATNTSNAKFIVQFFYKT